VAQEDVDRARIAGRVTQDVGVGRVDLDVGNEAEVLVLLANDLDVLAESYVLDGHGWI
jgi:hypothetical protein